MPCPDTFDEGLELVGTFEESHDLFAGILSWSLWFVLGFVAAVVQTAFWFDDDVFMRGRGIMDLPKEQRNVARIAGLIERLRPSSRPQRQPVRVGRGRADVR